MKKIVISLVFILNLFSIYLFYRQGHSVTELSTTPNSTPFFTTFELPNIVGIKYTNISEKEAHSYLSKVHKFEEFQRDHDAYAVLGLFTTPASDKEKEQLSWLQGDFPKQDKPKLYGNNQVNFKLNWFMIRSVAKMSDDNIIAEVLESRTYYDSSGNPNRQKEIYETDQETYVLVFKDDKIERYSTSGNKEKYSGFYYNI